MRIREVRRFLNHFIVFVNDPEDARFLKNDKRFSFYAGYRGVKNDFSGTEFKFDYRIKTLKAAKLFITRLLRKNRG